MRTRQRARVLICWRDSGALHGIGLRLLSKADSAHFPSDFHVPVVISLLDYRAIDFGQNLTAEVPTDIAGVQRPQGASHDAGAYEFCTTPSCIPPQPDPVGLVAWYTFDENTGTTAADGSGRGHTLTRQGNATWAPPAIGVASTTLDGNGDW
jgi:hypothetical protein